jgi:hypothetical protein
VMDALLALVTVLLLIFLWALIETARETPR